MSGTTVAATGFSSRLGYVSGALLLGGASKRMGQDKAHIESKGRAGSTRIAELLDGLFAETLLVGGEPSPHAPGVRVADVDGPACALRGIVTALAAAKSERVLVVARDLPYLNAEIMLALTAWPESAAVVPVDERGEQPLCAIYRREACLATGQLNLESNRLSLRGWLDGFETSRVPLSDLGCGLSDKALLTNVNTPEELAHLEGL